jgi:hypothetical protein
LAERLVWSRNTRSERSLYQGLAKRWSPDWRDLESLPSTAWLYEMKASYVLRSPGAREVRLAAPRIRTAICFLDRPRVSRHSA